MTRLTRRTLILSSAALAVPFVARAQDTIAASQTLRIGMVTPPSHRWTQTTEALATTLATASDGRMALQVFPSGQLGSEAQMLQQLQAGALDFGFFTVGELAVRLPAIGALTAPYLVRNGDEAAQLLSGPAATGMLEQLAPLGLHGLGYGQAGMRIVLLAKPLPQGGTVAGRKIRVVPMPQELDFWRRAGAAPTPLPLPELHDAYANGQIDGMQIDLEGTFNNRFYERSAEVIDTQHMIFPMVAVASARRWQTLPEADRALISDSFGDALARVRADYSAIDESYREQLRAAGVTLRGSGPELFGDAVTDWYAAWRNETPVLATLEAEAAVLR